MKLDDVMKDGAARAAAPGDGRRRREVETATVDSDGKRAGQERMLRAFDEWMKKPRRGEPAWLPWPVRRLLRQARSGLTFRLARRKGPSCGGGPGMRSVLWRELSWQVGDEQAFFICALLDVYCKLAGLDPTRINGSKVPR